MLSCHTTSSTITETDLNQSLLVMGIELGLKMDVVLEVDIFGVAVIALEEFLQISFHSK
mgnify:CR=1 FL=1